MDLRNHSLIKRVNRVKILDIIRRNTPIARAQIAGITGLDRKTLTNFINELIEEGIVEEAGKQDTPQGRPYTLLRFKEHFAGGISVESTYACGVVMDYYGKLRASRKIQYSSGASKEEVISAVRTIHEELTSTFPQVGKTWGLSIPGVLDVKNGILKYSVNLPCLQGEKLKDLLALPGVDELILEEVTNTKALAEKWFGAGINTRDFVFMDISGGIGLGLIINRAVYRGAGGYAGELGHVVIERGGQKCSCGKKGCLEAYGTEKAILNEYNKLTGKNIKHLSETKPDDWTKPEANAIIADAGTKIGSGIAALINIMSPGTVFLGGTVIDSLGSKIMPYILKSAGEESLQDVFSCVHISASQLKYSAACGSASMVLSKVFEEPDHYMV